MPSRISSIEHERRSLAFLPGAHVRRAPDGAAQASRDELLRHHAALLDAQHEQRELTELIVHDLKAPLSALRAGLSWVRGQLQPAQADLVEAVADAEAAAVRLTAMIGDLLVIARLDQNNLPVRREAVSLRSLFDLVVHTYARRAGEKGVALTGTPNRDLEVQADPTLLQRVMENIVDNALRYTRPNGHIALTAARRAEPRSRAIEIVVSNDGLPIPLSERALIFHKFARGSGAGTAAGSAGLGLYFCKRAVEAHGGAIAVVESPEWSTSFRITLP